MPDRHPATAAPLVSIIIKALNEEAHIAASIESALKALEGLEGEVILADSLSTDRTVEIARRYPVTIVQLVNPEERCCGIGPQLGYQHAKGEFVYILDGDMELEQDFLRIALTRFNEVPRLAGVAGQVQIIGGEGYEFQRRKSQAGEVFAAGQRPWLVCGGLYRRAALREVGHFSNRNLHAFEEKELGLRLVHAGWTLERLDAPALRHHVHNDDSVRLMLRRWRSRYVDGAGELLRAAWGTPYFGEVLAAQKKNLLFVCLWLSLACALLVSPWSQWPIAVASVGALSLILASIVRRKNLMDGLLSLANLQIYAAGFVRGLLAPQVDPRSPIACRVHVPEQQD